MILPIYNLAPIRMKYLAGHIRRGIARKKKIALRNFHWFTGSFKRCIASMRSNF